MERSWIRVAWAVLALGMLGVVIAACGGEEKQDEATPVIVTEPPVILPTEAEPDAAVTPSEPAITPTPLDSETLVADVGAVARIDLAAHLDISAEEITILDPETALLMESPLACPDIPEALADVDLYVIYLQHAQYIYPYQVYAPEVGQEPVVERCDDVLVDEEALFIPTPDIRAAILDEIRFDLENRGVDVTQGDFTTVQTITWTDEALGCSVGTGEAPAPAVIDGYLVIFEAGDRVYEYHTDAAGQRVVFCEREAGYESAQAFIEALASDENLEVEQVTDEVARYGGLDAEGILLTMTTRGYRVGVFEFDSPDEARAAAFLIDDLDVSRIFVSGPVLIVQEENSPQVYSALLAHAEEVRTPVIERREADATASAAENATPPADE